MTPTGRSRRLALAALAVAPLLALLPDGSRAQEPTKKAPAPAIVMPAAEKIVLLLRATMLTLNDALQTGNFTVLRDMASPAFREANSAARLSHIFGSLIQHNTDLSGIAILTPQIGEAPTLDGKTGMLRVKGYFPGQPTRLDFDVAYQPVGGRWRLFALAVQQTATTPETASTKAPTPAKKVDPPKAEPAKK